MVVIKMSVHPLSLNYVLSRAAAAGAAEQVHLHQHYFATRVCKGDEVESGHFYHQEDRVQSRVSVDAEGSEAKAVERADGAQGCMVAAPSEHER